MYDFDFWNYGSDSGEHFSVFPNLYHNYSQKQDFEILG